MGIDGGVARQEMHKSRANDGYAGMFYLACDLMLCLLKCSATSSHVVHGYLATLLMLHTVRFQLASPSAFYGPSYQMDCELLNIMAHTSDVAS